jgi:hypothetical protein
METQEYTNRDTGLYFPTNCKIAIIRVYNKALSSDVVLRNYNSQKLRFGL